MDAPLLSNKLHPNSGIAAVFLFLLSHGFGWVSSKWFCTELIDGLGRRGGVGYESIGLPEFNPLSLPFDAMDYLLGSQGLMTASAYEYTQKGDRSSLLVGFSLGAMDVGNLAAKGYAKNAYAYSLPLLNVGVSSLGVTNGRYDPVNLGVFGFFFAPHAKWSDASLVDHANYRNYPGLRRYDWNPKND